MCFFLRGIIDDWLYSTRYVLIVKGYSFACTQSIKNNVVDTSLEINAETATGNINIVAVTIQKITKSCYVQSNTPTRPHKLTRVARSPAAYPGLSLLFLLYRVGLFSSFFIPFFHCFCCLALLSSARRFASSRRSQLLVCPLLVWCCRPVSSQRNCRVNTNYLRRRGSIVFSQASVTGVWGAVKGLVSVVPWLFSFATTAEVKRRFFVCVCFFCTVLFGFPGWPGETVLRVGFRCAETRLFFVCFLAGKLQVVSWMASWSGSRTIPTVGDWYYGGGGYDANIFTTTFAPLGRVALHLTQNWTHEYCAVAEQ